MTSTFSLNTALIPLLAHPKVAAVIKWSVYGILTFNFVLYLQDDLLAYRSSVAKDAPISELLETFATTIDTVAWLGLIFLLELETYLLSDNVLESWLGKLLRGFRLLCAVSIAYAAIGYTIIAFDYYKITPQPQVENLCDLASQGIWLQTDSADYREISLENCTEISSGPPYYKVDQNVSLIDAPTLQKVQSMEWINVVNAWVWLLVVALIEIEIWLQWRDRFGRSLRVVQTAKTGSYLVLWTCAFAWLYFGYTLYGLDAIVWIAGFWAIELNLTEWEQERTAELGLQNR